MSRPLTLSLLVLVWTVDAVDPNESYRTPVASGHEGLSVSSTQVRRATPYDLATVARLFDDYRQFYGEQPDSELATQFIGDRLRNDQSVILVAEHGNGSIVGFCQLYPTFCSLLAAPIYALYDLYVRPDTRRGGAGRALLLAARQQAIEAGMARLDLTTSRTNLAAQKLYESLGWARDDIFIAYSLGLQA